MTAPNDLIEYRIKLLEDHLNEVLSRLDEMLTHRPITTYKLEQVERSLETLTTDINRIKEDLSNLKGSPIGKIAPGAVAGALITVASEIAKYIGIGHGHLGG